MLQAVVSVHRTVVLYNGRTINLLDDDDDDDDDDA